MSLSLNQLKAIVTTSSWYHNGQARGLEFAGGKIKPRRVNLVLWSLDTWQMWALLSFFQLKSQVVVLLWFTAIGDKAKWWLC